MMVDNKLELANPVYEEEVNINAKSEDEATALFHEEALRKEGSGKTPAEIIKSLLEAADINAKDSLGTKPLHYSLPTLPEVSFGDIVKLLKYEQNAHIDHIELECIAYQNYRGGKDVIVQIKNIDALREVILKLDSSDKKDDLLDELAFQETELTQKLPQYLSKKIQEGYENLENKQQDLQYLSHVSKKLAKDIKALKKLPSAEIDKASTEEKQDFEERLNLMQEYLDAYLKSICILTETEATNDLTNVADNTLQEGFEKLTMGETVEEEESENL